MQQWVGASGDPADGHAEVWACVVRGRHPRLRHRRQRWPRRVQLRGRPMGAAGGLRLGGAVNEVVICAVPADGAEFQDGFVAVRLLLAEVAASGLRTLYLHGLLAALYCRSSVL